MSMLVVTSLGDVVIDLYTDRCPLTCKNFLKLCKIKYYNGCLFHTVQKDFTAQTGDPTGTGTAGKGCFKCGAPDHITKGCPGEEKQLPPKYVLKDNNRQRGGVTNSKYDMVFDEEDPGSPQQGKRGNDRGSKGQALAYKRRTDMHSQEDLNARDDRRKHRDDADAHKHTDRARESSNDRYQDKRSHRSQESRVVEDRDKYTEKRGRDRKSVEDHRERDARNDRDRERGTDEDVRNRSDGNQSFRRGDRGDDRNRDIRYRKDESDDGKTDKRKRSSDDKLHSSKGREERKRCTEQDDNGSRFRSSNQHRYASRERDHDHDHDHR